MARTDDDKPDWMRDDDETSWMRDPQPKQPKPKRTTAEVPARQVNWRDYDERRQWHVAVTNSSLSAGHQVVLLTLVWFFNAEKGCAWPGNQTLAKMSGTAAKTVRHALTAGVRAGLVRREWSEGKRRLYPTITQPQMGTTIAPTGAHNTEENLEEVLSSTVYESEVERAPNGALPTGRKEEEDEIPF